MDETCDLGLIAVTGASGLLGSNLVFEILRSGGATAAVCHTHRLKAAGVSVSVCDLADYKRTAQVLDELRPRWVIHCAAATNVDWCETHREEARLLNIQAVRHLAAVARQLRCSFVYISTDSVFDGRGENYSETDLAGPLNVYAVSKFDGEAAAVSEMPDCLIIRTAFYGWSMQPKLSLAEWIINRLELGYGVPGFSDVVFSPILVNDLCRYMLAMMQRGLTGLYHLGGSEPCSKYQFAVRLAEIFGLNSSLIRCSSVANSNLQAPRPLNTSLNNAKIVRALGDGMPDLHSGLQRFKKLRDSGFAAQLKNAAKE